VKFWIACLIVALVAFACSSKLSARLGDTRAATDITWRSEALPASPMLAFTTVVLGGFHGIIADLLWLRATDLQDQGRYVELVQLAGWITSFEPRASQAWAFHAWNMAYNVSLVMPTPEEKWRWVRNGIRLLRDQGLAFNPRDPVLCFELSVLYQHKIGRSTDDAHMFYKAALARDMDVALGGSGSGHSLDEGGRALLKSRYSLDWDNMQALHERFGELDWRLPESHALYWAQRGVDVSPNQKNRRCSHIVVSALASTVFAGTFSWADDGQGYQRGPNVVFLPVAIKAYQDMITDYDLPDMNESLRSFLESVMPLLEAAGDAERLDLVRKVLEALPVLPPPM
jgi:hypothetical protein